MVEISNTLLAAAAGCALGVVGYHIWQTKPGCPAFKCKGIKKSSTLEERSTTSSAGGGSAAYETRKAVDEYIQFHFGSQEDLLPYANGPKEALNFTARIATLCEKYCEAAADFTGEKGNTLALDVGCAVGGASFELARTFNDVLGIDYSHAFVAAAQDLAVRGSRSYEALLEGEVRGGFSGRVDPDIDRTRVKFEQGDACALRPDLPRFDAVLAANLLCRLPDPQAFLDRLPTLVKPGGVAVLVSPYSWLAGWTDKSKWIGGYYKDGLPVRSAEVLADKMTALGFELVHQEDVPFLIREHLRKYQWGCSHACVWRLKKAQEQK